MLWTACYFILTLLILILIHEAGHFWVARWCGVQVSRFSFGFGPVLASKRDKKGTEFAISAIPLGGYIQLTGKSNALIILAGPLANFVFAWVALWCAAMIGMMTLAPIVGDVAKGSVAAHAGLMQHDEFIAIQDKPVKSWQDVQYALMPYMGESGQLAMRVISRERGMARVLKVPLGAWSIPTPGVDSIKSMGITPYLPTITPRVGEVLAGTPAMRAGLLPLDEIIAVDEHPIHDWRVLVAYVKSRPNQTVTLLVQRGASQQIISVQLGEQIKDKQVEGVLGVMSAPVEWPQDLLRWRRQNPIDALVTATKQTVFFTHVTLLWMKQMLLGHVPINNLSGPLGIAQGAGMAAMGGLVYYLLFLAIVSIGLGILNLLPIPMLDGGQLVYCFIEWIMGRPLSERVKSLGFLFGLTLLMALTAIALSNDVNRFIRS